MSRKRSWLELVVDLVESSLARIPSEEERSRLVGALDVLIAHLSEVRQNIVSLPSDPDRKRLQGALDDIHEFLAEAMTNPSLASVLGVGKTRKSSGKSGRALDAMTKAGAEVIVRDLDALSTNDIQRRLLDPSEYSTKELRAVADLLGIPPGRLNREQLIDKIVKIGFANRRGYDLLKRGVR